MNTTILEIIENAEDFPTLSPLAAKLNHLVNQSDVALSTIAAHIETDAALSARLLKTVNSGYYHLKSSVFNIQQAVTLLGLKTIRNIIFSASILDTFQSKKGSVSAHYENLFLRSVCAGAAAHVLSDITNQKQRDEIFLSALLQNLGKFVLLYYLQDDYANILNQSKDALVDTYVIEKNDLKIHNGQAGTIIAEKWNLPTEIVLSIRYKYSMGLLKKRDFPEQTKNTVRFAYLAGLAADVFVGWNKASKIALFNHSLKEMIGEDSKILKYTDILPIIPQYVENFAAGMAVRNLKIKSFEEIKEYAEKEIIGLNYLHDKTYYELISLKKD